MSNNNRHSDIIADPSLYDPQFYRILEVFGLYVGILEMSKKKDSPVLPGSAIQDIPDKTDDNDS